MNAKSNQHQIQNISYLLQGHQINNQSNQHQTAVVHRKSQPNLEHIRQIENQQAYSEHIDRSQGKINPKTQEKKGSSIDTQQSNPKQKVDVTLIKQKLQKVKDKLEKQIGSEAKFKETMLAMSQIVAQLEQLSHSTHQYQSQQSTQKSENEKLKQKIKILQDQKRKQKDQLDKLKKIKKEKKFMEEELQSLREFQKQYENLKLEKKACQQKQVLLQKIVQRILAISKQKIIQNNNQNFRHGISEISYQYYSLCEKANEWEEFEIQSQSQSSMLGKSINSVCNSDLNNNGMVKNYHSDIHNKYAKIEESSSKRILEEKESQISKNQSQANSSFFEQTYKQSFQVYPYLKKTG